MPYATIPPGSTGVNANDLITTLGSAGNTITVSGLNGDTAGAYMCYLFQAATSAGNGNYFRPNGVTTNQAGGNCLAVAGAIVATEGGGNETVLRICQGTGSGWMWFYAKTGGHRSFNSFVPSSGGVHWGGGVWTDTTTVLSSISIVKDAGNFAIGSYLVVRPLYIGV